MSTHGALPGAVMPPYCSCAAAFLPRLPAAVTTTMPRVDGALGGERQRVGPVRLVTAAPTERLTTRML